MKTIGLELRKTRTEALRKAGVPDMEIIRILNDLDQLDRRHVQHLYDLDAIYKQNVEFAKRKWHEEVTQELVRAVEEYAHNRIIDVRETDDHS